MGWKDYHFHQFIIYKGDKRTTQPTYIGIPNGDMDDDSHLTGWETKVADYLGESEKYKIIYEYDFGDSWAHLLTFEGYVEKDPAVKKYPICCDGAMSCPPEDSGGTYGYYDLVDIIKDKNHPEHQERLEWLGYELNPKEFNKEKIRFRNPKIKLKEFLSHMPIFS